METCILAGGIIDGDEPSDLTAVYPVVEIFNSVQGEGARAGESSIFIRFGHCNLRCEWCDTEFDEWTDMTVIDILAKISHWPCKNVIFTGGEPALQNLWPLSRCLRKRGFHLAIESNGTIEIPEGLVNWICISPKDQLYPDVSIKQQSGDELKVIYCGQNLEMYSELEDGFDNLFLQPCYMESESVEWNGRNFALTEEVVKQNPRWRLSLQVHKWMGVD
ncbi:MAG: 7-carboxy-7-deazaguanine synthase QueE [Candidatus Poseidoniaceae archaeon]|jgi:organic radical activating enzyme|nr:7-carboxy-7-deazaguanine synthase QueE [Candidatus Poseidoniaceae archaeon]